MRRSLLAGVAVAALMAAFAVPADAAPPGPNDRRCSFAEMYDPNPEAPPGTRAGALDGGPILQSGTLTCTVQVGGALHSSPNNGMSASAADIFGVTYLSPTLGSLSVPDGTPLYVCSAFTDTAGTTWYYDGMMSRWVTDPNVPCGPAMWPSQNPYDVVETLQRDVVDPLLCALIVELHPSLGPIDSDDEGDVYLLGERIVDCLPYDQ